MSRINARLRGDDGMAMVMTIGLMMLTAIIGTTLLATTVFTTSNTTATRADVEAVAAAEAGIEAVMASLQSGALACDSTSSFSSPAGFVDYDVTIEHRPAGSAVWSPGCAADADAIRLESVGYAENLATGGNVRGNEATVEMLMERPNPQPRFNKAIFGDLSMNYNTNVTVTQAGGLPAALFTNGPFLCSKDSTVEGSLYVAGTATFKSRPCEVVEDLYVEGNFNCSAGTTIGGNAYVQGNVHFSGPCNVAGDLWVGGTLNNTHGGNTVIGGDLLVGGNMTANPMPTLTPGSTIRVGGTIGFSWAGPRNDFFNAHPGATENDPSVPPPPEIPEAADDAFPKIFADGTTSYVGSTEPPAESIWAGWATASWRDAVRSVSSDPYAEPCSPWNVNMTGPIIVDSNTVFDSRSECSEVKLVGNNTTIQLNADAVLLANSINIGQAFRVESGDGQPHTLYLIVPWPTSQQVCQDSPTAITVNGAWQQDNLSSVLFYGPGKVSFTNHSPVIRGQLYGCVVDAQTNFTLNYVPVGDVSSDTTLQGLRLQHIRDVTN